MNLRQSQVRPNSARPNSTTLSINNSLSKSTINVNRREKLKTLLYEKYKKKFGKILPEKEVREELDSFMRKDNPSEKDLKDLDKRIEKIVMDNQSKKYLYANLKGTNGNNSEAGTQQAPPGKKSHKSSTLSNYSRSKKGDIGYQDDNFSDIAEKGKRKPSSTMKNDDDDKVSVYSHQKQIDRLEFDEKGEWNAIAEFNKEEFRLQREQQRLKDRELKNKTKNDLTRQMNECKMRKEEERKQDLQFGEVVHKTVDFLNHVEYEKWLKEKEKGLKEKQIRDEQMKDQRFRQKQEFKSQREFDNKLLQKIKEETEAEEKKMLRMKKEKHEELLKTLEENEKNKKLQLERLEQEKQEDIQAQIEYGKILDKQEKERADYFRDREKKGNTFISLMVENVIKEQEMKNKKQDETIKKYQDLKDKMDQEEEDRRKKFVKDTKMNMKSFLLSQSMQKQQVNEKEKLKNKEYSKIWKIEVENGMKQDQEHLEKIKQREKQNAEYLKLQMEIRRQEERNQKMNDTEYRLNKELLEAIKVGDHAKTQASINKIF